MVGQVLKERVTGELEGDTELGNELLERSVDPYRAVGMLVERVQRGSGG